MTDDQKLTEDQTDTPEDQTEDTPAEDAPTEEEPTEDTKPGREAARYRRQLREVEAERDALVGTVDGLRRTMAETALAGTLAKPSALWMTGTSPGAYFNEEGVLDLEALTTAAREAVRSHGIAPFRRFQGGADGGARGSQPEPAPSFEDAFKPRRTR